MIIKRFMLIILIFAFLKADEFLIRVRRDTEKNVRFYEKYIGISIVDAQKDYFIAVAKEEKLQVLRENKIKFEIIKRITPPPKGLYLDYQQILDSLNLWVTQYPNISKLDTVGYSVNGRLIIAIKISDTPHLIENEPRIRLGGSIHGNEKIGAAIMMYFIKYLLSNYSSNQNVKNLIDEREIVIIPVLNPDGYVLNSRYNANGVDLNRDFGFMWDGWGSSSSPFSQIETKYIQRHAEEFPAVFDFNYHSAATYVNYPWDYHPHDPPDSLYIISLSYEYADSSGLTPINGYDWYQVCGSLQDAVLGIMGGLSWTIETPEPFNGSSQIDSICELNRKALMAMLEKCGQGFGGNVRDSSNLQPISARIEIINPLRTYVYTCSYNGFYFKSLPPGNYQIRICANRHMPRETTITIPLSGSMTIDFYLGADENYRYAFRPVYINYAEHAETGNYTHPFDALGEPDGKWYSLGNGGEIVLDMYGAEIYDVPGIDFIVYEGSGTNEGYKVYLSEDKYGPWTFISSGTGTDSFDISGTGITHARYIRIVDDNDNSSSGTYAGFDLDAVYSFPQVNAPNILITSYQILDGNNGVLEPNETADFLITLKNAGLMSAENISGKLRTLDAYLQVLDSTTFYGTIEPDSEKTNDSDPFILYVEPATPQGHIANLELILTGNNYNDTITFKLTIGKKHYFVWDPDPNHSSGPIINSLLQELDYSGDYSTTLSNFSKDLYMALFVCVGIYPNNYRILANSQEALVIEDFAQNSGGRVYLEGGDVWYWDPLYGGHNFGPLFGINAIEDGTDNLGPVQGQIGTFTENMYFNYSGENDWIDHIQASGSGAFNIFYDTNDNYYCGVARDAGVFKTVGMSFELAGLSDGADPSTKSALLDSIMHFFGIYPVKVKEYLKSITKKEVFFDVSSNIIKDKSNIIFLLPRREKIIIEIKDISGRTLRRLINKTLPAGVYRISWDLLNIKGNKISSGIYFITFKSKEKEFVKKVIILK